MIPRGYFARVGAFVGWVLLCIMALLAAVQVSRMFHAETRGDAKDELPYAQAKKHLHLCDCFKMQTDIDYESHSKFCSYRTWYEGALERNKRKEGE